MNVAKGNFPVCNIGNYIFDISKNNCNFADAVLYYIMDESEVTS